MIVLARIRQNLGAPNYLTTSYMGEMEAPKDGKFMLSKVCMVYEELQYILDPKTGQPTGSKIDVKYLTNSLVTNGKISFNEADFIFVREIEEDDELMGGYESSLEAFRMEKAGLQKASIVPASAPRALRKAPLSNNRSV